MAVAIIEPFFDPATYTYSYVIGDPATGCAAIVDPVLDFDPASGQTSHRQADRIVSFVEEQDLEVKWLLETHVHADHLTGAAYLRSKLGGRIGVGENVRSVQEVFGNLFNAGPEFCVDGSQFDKLFRDEETFSIGDLKCRVLHTPGHTPACVTYVLDGAAFVGDTIFMPDFGTARTDFPGGDARALYGSIHRILSLPGETVLYMCHDYGSEQRSEFSFSTTVAAERLSNVMVNDAVSEDEFVCVREARDADLAAPQLLLPSVQFNMRAGQLPPAESNGTHYFKIPVRKIA